MTNSTIQNESPHERGKRRHLRPDEANALIDAAGKAGRQPLRDQVLLRLMYRHGLRVSEAIGARWDAFDIEAGTTTPSFYVHRLKGSRSGTHALQRDEVIALRKLRAAVTGPYVFPSERGNPLSPDMVARVVDRAAKLARIPFHVWPHMLRHSAGYMLANAGEHGTDIRLIAEFLGHASLNNTMRYTALSAKRMAHVVVR